MESKYKWNLEEIFENQNQLEEAIEELYRVISEIKKYKGTLSKGVNQIYNCYKTLEKALELHEKIYGYAMLKYHQDMSNQESIKLYKRIENLSPFLYLLSPLPSTNSSILIILPTTVCKTESFTYLISYTLSSPAVKVIE